MKLITNLRKNDGQFDYEDFADNISEYELAIKSLLKKKDYELAYKILKCYIDQYKEIASGGIFSYRPGMDYICSPYLFLEYAKIMEKGIKGIVKKNKKEADASYLEVLKRYHYLSGAIKRSIFNKRELLLRHAYPDLNDKYSVALNRIGDYLYEKKKYSEAFKFYKKGADFNCDGRQICFPYYLISINQDRVADMYRYGKGVKKNINLAKKYYQKCADNCGLEHHLKSGDFFLEKERYAEAFMRYTETNIHFPNYDLTFLLPDHLLDKFKIIFDGINAKPENKRTKRELIALAMMYKGGLGCEKDEDKAVITLPIDADWAFTRIKNFIYTYDISF